MSRVDVEHVMESFPIIRKRDVAKHGDYRVKLQIIDSYDAMAKATQDGHPYHTPLDPPPGDSRVAHNRPT